MSEPVTVAELLAERQRLLEVLRPFAQCRFLDSRPPEGLVLSTLAGAVYVGDFRRAREALERAER